MSASSQKTIVVVGATGNQGGSVARTFLNLPDWSVRIMTRKPSSPAAQALGASGAEIVQADLSDPPTLSSAFQDAHAVFLNTDFWETFVPLFTATMTSKAEGQPDPSKVAFETEVSHGKNAVNAIAQIPTLERLVYSVIPPVSRMTNGKHHSTHSDSKDAVVEYIAKEFPELAKKTSFIYMGAYFTNALLDPKVDPSDGKYKYFLPFNDSTKLPIIDAKTSTGPFVKALIEDEQPGVGLLAYNTNSYLTYRQIRDIWSRASGKEVEYVERGVEFLHQTFHLPMEILEVLPALGLFGYTGSMSLLEPSDLKNKVKSTSWEEWMMGRDWKEILAPK